MKTWRKISILISCLLLAAGCSTSAPSAENPTLPASPEPSTPVSSAQVIDFAQFNSVYQFSAQIPQEWKVEYVPAIESINIYDPQRPGSNPREQSLIFIRYFRANTFLTLSTVDVLKRAETSVQGRAAVNYEIKKKNGVPNFPQQPAWRNEQHKLIDIRYSTNNPSPFFVFAYNPELPETRFEEFVQSLNFK
jgi:hypothetical protein